MSADKLKLEVLMGLVEKVTGPLKNITKGSSSTAKALKAAKDELKQLNDAQKRIDGFRKLDKDLSIVKNGMKGAQDRIKSLKDEIAKLPAPTKDMARALKQAQAEASNLKGRYTSLLEKQQRLRTELNATGMDTAKLATHQRDLAGKINLATAAVDKQVQAMQRQNAQAQRMHAAQANYQKAMGLHGRMTGAGRMAIGAGVAAGAPMALAVRQYASFEDAMMGVARQVAGSRDTNGKLTATYYEIGDAIKAMSERIPLATNELAEILAMGARMGIQGKQDLLAFTETSAVMAAAFDISAGEIGESMGRLSQLYKVPIKDIGQLGDAINWLDDNALSQGGDIIDVMQRIAGSAAMAKMNFKEAAALGSSFLSLGAGSEVAASASNAMIRELSIATMQTKRFRGGLAMLKLDAQAIQLGMSKDATGTILKVLDAIRALPQEQQLEAATRMFGKEFGDDAAKLAANIGEYRRQLELVNQAQAKGSMDREAQARLEALSAQYMLAKNSMFAMATEIGANLKPALVGLLKSGAEVQKNVRDWMKENPGLTSALVKIAAVGAVVVTVIGAIVFAIGALIAPIALLKFGLTWLGVSAGGAVSGLLAFLNPLAKLAAAFSVGYAVGTLINGWLDSFVSKIFGYKTSLGGAIFDIVQMFKQGNWSQIGMLILRGIEAGLDFLTMGLYSKMKNIAGGLITTAKKVFGIKSPSTVFNVLGRYTMAGLSGGIDAGRQGAVAAVSNAARKVAAAGAGMLLGGAAMAGPAIDTRPALTGQGGGTGGLHIGSITIQAAPGQSAQDIASAVRAELEKLERQRGARGRSRLSDKE
jgi:TP901 family phage tail tape measure protein